MGRRIKLMDLTLRDGMHAVAHQFTPETMAFLAEKIDTVGVDYIEFGHGNGLGGSSLQYGLGAGTDLEYIEAVTKVVKNSQLSVITIPGIGTRFELQMAYDHGIRVARFATQMSECDIAKQHIQLAKQMGFSPWSTLPHAKCGVIISLLLSFILLSGLVSCNGSFSPFFPLQKTEKVFLPTPSEGRLFYLISYRAVQTS